MTEREILDEEENLVHIQNEINKILKEEFEKVIEENKTNILIGLLLDEKIETLKIDELIQLRCMVMIHIWMRTAIL